MATQPRSAAIFYSPDDYDPSKSMMGRRVASEAFIRAVARYEPSPEIFVACGKADDVKTFREVQERMGAPGNRTYRWARSGDVATLAPAGCLFRADPVLHEEAWRRQSMNTRIYSLCGVTHTLSSVNAQNALTQYLVAPYEEWDAVICTSHAVRRAIDHILAEYGAYLAERLGAPQPPRPVLQLPVIPLGVHAGDFDTTTPAQREARTRWRAQLGIGENDVVALFVGRLAHHAKANPYPMYRALEEAARRTQAKLHLVQAGWFANDFLERAFREPTQALCPSVTCHFLDGRDPVVRAEVWAIGDFFTSLVDNIQETFGLAPIEAMAAGLPVVASDWDGYRETVRDGEDGILVRTLMSPPGIGDALAARHVIGLDNYDNYLAATALNVAVDIRQAANAYATLAGDAGLRARMGDAGRSRARGTFEWQRVYGRYRELWGELAARREHGTQRTVRKPGQSANASHPDPFRLFAHYPTTTFNAGSRVKLAQDSDEAAWANVLSLTVLKLGNPRQATLDDALAIRALLSGKGGEMKVADLVGAAPPARREIHARALPWLLKAGLIEIEDRVAVPNRAGPLT